jgi:hypothetical protein
MSDEIHQDAVTRLYRSVPAGPASAMTCVSRMIVLGLPHHLGQRGSRRDGPITLVKAPALIYTIGKTFSHSHRHAFVSGVGVGWVE